jgi:hypothetical protein
VSRSGAALMKKFLQCASRAGFLRRHQAADRRLGRRSATVKWFSPEKGFGLVVLDGGRGEAFLDASVLEQSGQEGTNLLAANSSG